MVAAAGKPKLPPQLPLPEGYFGDIQLTNDERTNIHDTMRAQLEFTLEKELAFVHTANRQVDPAKWRLAKRKRELRVFRRHARASVFTGGTGAYEPSVLAVGRIEGSIEDVLLGAYHTSHDEVKTTVAFTKGATDCTVLTNLELATPEDPFHYLGVKWFYTQLPASLIIKPRDWCLAHALGIERDSHGELFGYYMLRSVDINGCPPFDQRAVVRGKAQLCCIYREPVPGIVEVYAHGLYDPAGELIQHFSTIMTTRVVTSVFQLARCAEVKKLTMLALRNFQHKRAVLGQLTSDSISRVCARCRGKSGYFSSLKPCGVCLTVVCSQCRVKKSIFAGASHSAYKVSCCVQCIVEAKKMVIRPSEPSFSILGEQYLPHEQYVGLESSESLDDPNFPATKRLERTATGAENDRGEVSWTGTDDDGDEVSWIGDDDDDTKVSIVTKDLSDLDVDQYRLGKNGGSGISENDMELLLASNNLEKLLASMLAERQQGREEQQKRLDDNASNDSRSNSNASTSNSEGHSPMRFTSDLRTESERGESFVSDSINGANSFSSRTSGSAAVASGMATPAAAATRGMTTEQAAVYNQILALQSAANEAYWMARANGEMMRSSP